MTVNVLWPLTLLFLLGVSWRFFSRASKAYRSKLRAYPSRWAFITANWDVFFLRTFPWNSGLFAMWMFHPDWLAKALIYAHAPQNLANWIIVTPNLATSFLFGFTVDYALDQVQIKLAGADLPAWFPDALKGEIPQYDQNVVNGAAFVQTNDRDTGMSNAAKTNGGN